MTHQCPSGYDSSCELPSGLLLGLFLEAFSFFLLFGAKFPVGVDRRFEVFDVLLQLFTMLGTHYAQRLYTNIYMMQKTAVFGFNFTKLTAVLVFTTRGHATVYRPSVRLSTCL